MKKVFFQSNSTKLLKKIQSRYLSSDSVKNDNKFERRIIGRDVEIDQQKIHFKSVGWGPKNVLMMPGALGTAMTDFSVQLNEMDLNKYSLYAWDPPGHGDSRPPEKRFKNFYERDASKAADLMKLLCIDRYSVMGWSDGGITAMILAANQGRDNVDKLIIWGSNAYFTYEDYDSIVKIRDVAKSWSKAFRDRFEPIYGEKGLQQLWLGLVAYYVSIKDVCSKDLPNIKADTLILHGDKDPLVAPEHPEYLLKHISKSKLCRFPQGRHDIHLNPKSSKEFNKIVDKFLSES